MTAIGREFLNGEGFVEIVTHHPATPRLAIKEMGFQDGGAVFTCFKAVGPDVDGRMLIPY